MKHLTFSNEIRIVCNAARMKQKTKRITGKVQTGYWLIHKIRGEQESVVWVTLKRQIPLEEINDGIYIYIYIYIYIILIRVFCVCVRVCVCVFVISEI